MKIHNMPQNSEEWDAIRLGKFTASVADALLMDEKNKGFINLIKKVSEERYTGEPCESKVWQGNQFTDRGHELEPVAAMDYTDRYFDEIEIIGFAELNDWVGCSPDGFIEDNGMIQIKCPIFDTQYGYLQLEKDYSGVELMKKISLPYYKQMQFELMVTGREYNVFYSYHPHLKEVRIKLFRDLELIKQIQERLLFAIKTVNNRIKTFNQR